MGKKVSNGTFSIHGTLGSRITVGQCEIIVTPYGRTAKKLFNRLGVRFLKGSHCEHGIPFQNVWTARGKNFNFLPVGG